MMMISLTEQRVVFIISWLAYASAYFLRKPVGVLKPAMEKELGFPPLLLGFLDVALLLPYALVQMFCGHWVSVYGTRQTFAVCLWLSALVAFPLGIIYSSFNAIFLQIFLEGGSQALLWPCCVRLLDSWTGDKGRNTVMGVFNTSAFAGGIASNFLSIWILTTVGWRLVFPISSLYVGAMGVVVFFTCHENPAAAAAAAAGVSVQPESQALEVKETKELIEVEEFKEPIDPSSSSSSPLPSSSIPSQTHLSWRDLWSKPGFLQICVCILCLKVTRYFVYMWLPYLYTKEFDYSEAAAGTAASGFEFGGVFGSVLIGYFIDQRLSGDALRGVVYFVFVAFLSFLCFTLSSSLSSYLPLWLPQLVFIAINGAANAGSDAMLGSAIPAKLGAAYGGSTAAIAGLINGFGTVGSFLQGPLSGLIGGQFGWSANLYLMLGLNLVAALSAASAYKIRRGS